MPRSKGIYLYRIIAIISLIFVIFNVILSGAFLRRRMYKVLDTIEASNRNHQNSSAKWTATVDETSCSNLSTPTATSTTVKNFNDGYSLASRVNKKCNRPRLRTRNERVFGSYKWGSVETCLIWKVGTTFIRRLYMMKSLPKYKKLINPYEIRFDADYKFHSSISNQSGLRFMFVRNPYKRLLSGYADKLLAPNPVYWQIIGVPAIRLSRQNSSTLSQKCGHDLQFYEYIKYIIQAFNPKVRGAKLDGHFDRMVSLCKPCRVRYDFVGKMESFAVDSIELLRRLNFSDKTVKLIETEGGKLAWMDALKDTAHQPFDIMFRNSYTNCISFYSALRRSWKKMQVRGIIGRQEFPLKESEINALTESEFIQLAITAREHSTSEERKKLQEEYFIELFSTVPKGDLEMIRKLYASDFELFEYDDRPNNLFSNKTD